MTPRNIGINYIGQRQNFHKQILADINIRDWDKDKVFHSLLSPNR